MTTADTDPIDYLKLLEYSYDQKWHHQETTRLEWLAVYVFGFTTYCGEMDTLFAGRAIEVCKAISSRTTFQYITDQDNHVWYLLMCNMPFFKGRLEWGSSIRGAWWSPQQNDIRPLDSCGFWRDGEQWLDIEFTPKEWVRFIEAVIAFAEPEMQPSLSTEATDHDRND